MKKTLFLVSLFTLLIVSCSPIKITNRYAVPDISKSVDNKYLVIVRSQDVSVRSIYESQMARDLKEKGIDAIALTSLYSILDPNAKVTEAEVDTFVNELKNKGFNGILVTVLKNVDQKQKTYETGGGYSMMYPSYYYGFRSFYYNPWAYSDWGPTSYATESYKVYQVQTNVYDLTRTPDKQLIAVVSSEITNPDNFISLAGDFSAKVVSTLESK